MMTTRKLELHLQLPALSQPDNPARLQTNIIVRVCDGDTAHAPTRIRITLHQAGEKLADFSMLPMFMWSTVAGLHRQLEDKVFTHPDAVVCDDIIKLLPTIASARCRFEHNYEHTLAFGLALLPISRLELDAFLNAIDEVARTVIPNIPSALAGDAP